MLKYEELDNIAQLVPEDRRAIANNLVDELKFMINTLNELKEKIEEQGVVDHFKQGKQEFLRENPALKSYTMLVQKYSMLYKQLVDMLPKGETVKGELEDFLTVAR